jgi:hypothetical protein
MNGVAAHPSCSVPFAASFCKQLADRVELVKDTFDDRRRYQMFETPLARQTPRSAHRSAGPGFLKARAMMAVAGFLRCGLMMIEQPGRWRLRPCGSPTRRGSSKQRTQRWG